MSLLRNSVLVRTVRVGPGSLQSVVVEYRLVALVEVAALAVLQLVRRSRQVVAPDHLGRCPKFPQRSLQSAHKRHERLAEAYLRVAPARMTQYELEHHMRKRLSAYRHLQTVAVREVHLRLTPRRMLLLEVHLTLRPVQRAPVPYTSLQRPQVRCVEPSGMTLVQPVENSRRCEYPVHIRLEQRLYFSAHTPANGSGLVLFLILSFFSDGTVPYSSSAPTSRSCPMPPLRPAVSCLSSASASSILPVDR